MSILATELDWPEGTRFFEVRCRLGIWDVDGWDLDKEPEVKTLGGTVRITPRTPTGRIRILESDGKYRVVVTPPLTFAIDEFTGRLVNTADNTEGVWVVDPASDTVDPKDFTYSAVVTPKVGSPFTVEFDGTVAINGIYDLANGTTVAPSRGVSVLESRIAKLEQEGGLPHGDIPIFATLAEAQDYEAANPGNLALTIETVEPDTTPPTLGTLSVKPDGTKAYAIVIGATDDRGHVEYSFQLGDATWSPWQVDNTYTFNDLQLSTTYGAKHRVRDRAGQVVTGYQQSFTTLDQDSWGSRATDSFSTSGHLIDKLTETGGLTWGALAYDAVADGPTTTGSLVPTVLDGVVYGEGNNLRPGRIPPAGPYLSARTAYYSETHQGVKHGGDTPAFGAMVRLPIENPKRVRMEFSAIAGYDLVGGAGNKILPIIAGRSNLEFSVVEWGRSEEWAINPRFESLPADTSGIWQARFPVSIAWNYNGIEKYIVEVEGDTVTFTNSAGQSHTQSGVGHSHYGGPYYGFLFNSVKTESAVHDFSIQWE